MLVVLWAKNKETCQLRKLTGLKMQVCKPGSVLAEASPHHLSGRDFATTLKQSTRHACYY
jgi:hypothetical protein